MPRPETEAAYDRIMESSIFRTDGEDIDLSAALITLVDEIKHEDKYDDTWIYMGEGSECDCASLLIGAYWALTEWHGGQRSPEYAAMCAIGTIYQPNMASGPEPDSMEQIAYDMICDYYDDLYTETTP